MGAVQGASGPMPNFPQLSPQYCRMKDWANWDNPSTDLHLMKSRWGHSQTQIKINTAGGRLGGRRKGDKARTSSDNLTGARGTRGGRRRRKEGVESMTTIA
eukprot:12403539-Karenia_brevis.AAC.2